MVFHIAEVLNFNEIHLIVCFHRSFPWCHIYKMSCSKSSWISLMLSSGGFTVLHIYLGLLMHFELIFMKVVKSVSRLIILHIAPFVVKITFVPFYKDAFIALCLITLYKCVFYKWKGGPSTSKGLNLPCCNICFIVVTWHWTCNILETCLYYLCFFVKDQLIIFISQLSILVLWSICLLLYKP